MKRLTHENALTALLKDENLLQGGSGECFSTDAVSTLALASGRDVFGKAASGADHSRGDKRSHGRPCHHREQSISCEAVSPLLAWSAGLLVVGMCLHYWGEVTFTI